MRWVLTIIISLVVIGYAWFAHWRIIHDEQIIITVPKTQSYLTTGEYKTIDIDFLTNHNTSIITMEEAYESLTLITESTTTNLTFESISHRGFIEIDGQTMYQYVIRASIPFYTEGVVLYDDAASLDVLLTNGQTMSIPLGSFAYHAKTPSVSKLRLNHLHNIPSSDDYGVTAQGMIFEFSNAYEHDVTITNVSILNESVIIDQRLIVNTDIDFSMAINLNEIIDDSQIHQAIIGVEETQQFVVKFHHVNPYRLYRYPIMIEYEINDNQKSYLLEDFLFINTNPYVINNQSLFKEVELND